ncbi:MAG: C25 family cysteine peptidase, partial [Cytophagaceae bacterium]|nr:C25 family cysteine peptidase [Cytophagaceae bacterium]
MMRNALRCFFIFLIFTASSGQLALAQRSADGWVNPAQTYYKIPTVQNGMYRLKAEDLKKVGLPGSVNPQALQLFHRGEEVSIFVQGEADGTFDAGDFVEFYGIRNDGTLDSALYYPREAQPHRFYNLYSDTTAYFLTWRLDGSKGRRMTTYQEKNTQNLPPEPYYWVTNRQVYTGDFSAGTFHPLGLRSWSAAFYTHYDWGEAYTGGAYKSGQTGKFGFDLSQLKKDAGVAPEIQYQLLGRNPDMHTALVAVGPQPDRQRPLDTLSLDGFRHQTYRATVPLGDVAANGELHFSLTSRDPMPTTPEALGVLPWTFCATYIQVRYPAQPVLFAPQLALEPRLNPAGRSYFEISNVASGSVLYDLSDEHHPIRIGSGYVEAGAKLQAIVRQTNQPRRLLLASQFVAPLAIRPVRFRALPAKADFLLVTHEGLMKPATGYSDPVRAYAAYRASAAGGRHDTLVVTMSQLVDQFNYGEWSPTAIRNFAETLHRRAGAQFLFLVGQSRWPHHMRLRTDRYALDPVPNAGWPSADMPLVMGLNGQSPFVPAIPVGRLNAATPQQVADYLNKVKEHESAPASALWRKKILHLSGGKSPGELSLFKSNVDGFKHIAESGPVGVNVQTLSKKTDGPVESFNVAQQINEGVGLVTFFGHSGGDITDIDIGFCSNDQLGYRNKGRYPLLLINGCEAGNIFYDGGQKSFATDWVNTPDRGAILALAHASSGYPGPLKTYSDQLYQVQFADSAFAGKPFGTVLREAIRRLVSMPGTSFYEIGHAQQVMLQGDPAVTLFPATKPDYAVDNAGLFLQAIDNQKVVAASDSFRIGVVLSNLGRVPGQAVQLSIKRTLSNGTVVDYGLQMLAPVAYQDTLFFTLRNDKTNGGGPNRFEVVIDPDRRLDESSRDNNRATLDITIPGFSATPLFPPDFGVLNTTANGAPTATLTAQATQVLTKNGKVVSR